jgi:hypothetical protein
MTEFVARERKLDYELVADDVAEGIHLVWE